MTEPSAAISAMNDQRRLYTSLLDKEAEAKELLTALQEARDMLKDLGMHDDSVGLAGINGVIKKYADD